MKNKYNYFFRIIALILAVIVIIVLLRGNEDDWIKDDKGVYVPHGNPANVSELARVQQEAVACALGLYTQEKIAGKEFDSQCLGTCGDYAVDIVHVPRNESDNKRSNQCEEYISGKVSKFIEIDKNGTIVRIE